MPSIAFTVPKRTEISFSIAVPRSDIPVSVNVVDDAAGDILAHIDFRHRNNSIVISDKMDEQWGRGISHKLEYGSIVQGKFIIKKTFLDIVIGEHTYTKSMDRDLFGLKLRFFADFRYVSIDSEENSVQAFSRRWPLLLRHETRTWLTSRLSMLPGSVPQKVGLSGVIAFNGDKGLLEATVASLHAMLDEIVVAVYDTASVDIAFFNRLQSRYFNLRYHLGEYLQQDDGAVHKAYFLNGLIGTLACRNVLFVDPFADSERLKDTIRTRRLRLRRDHFAVVQEDDGGVRRSVLAMSVQSQTYFFDANGCVSPSPQDFALRNLELLTVPLGGGGLDWSIDIEGYVDDQGRTAIRPEVSLKGYLSGHVPAPRPRIIFMIVSCVRNRHKQDAIRRTWAKDLERANIDYVFIEGHPSLDSPIELEDRILLDCPDTYEYLSYKIYKGISAVRELYRPDFLLKIDDDCILNVEKFLELDLSGYDYIGTNIVSGASSTLDWHKKSVMNGQIGNILFKPNDDVEWFDGQGGYVLSMKAMDMIRSLDLVEFGHILEDYAVGRALHRKIEMPARISCRFTSIRESDMQWDEDYRNTIIMDVSSPEKMEEIHERFQAENRNDRQERAGLHVVISEK